MAALVVIDASALLELLLRGEKSERITAAVDQAELLAPDIANPEVAQALRGLERAGKLAGGRASTALMRLAESHIARVPTGPLMGDVWAMRANLSAYDACYVALARALRCPLLTSDRALARAPHTDLTVICV